MKQFIKLTIALILGVITLGFQSCSDSGKKYKTLSEQSPLTIAMVDAVGSEGMTPEKFYQFINSDFDKSVTQRTDDGIVVLYQWNNNNKCKLSDGEDFYCCAQYDFKKNPQKLTLSTFGMVYKASPTELDKYYSAAMANLEPLMTRWGFERNSNLETPTSKFYLKGKDYITIVRDDESITISRSFQ